MIQREPVEYKENLYNVEEDIQGMTFFQKLMMDLKRKKTFLKYGTVKWRIKKKG